jgi:hypothetical protein
MTNPDAATAALLQRGELAFRWYQTKLGFWQAIWGTLITGGLAVAIPAGVESYKVYQERQLKEQEIALKNKEIEGKIQDSDQIYISRFLETALKPDIEMRIRLSQYFSYVSGDKYREGWEKFRVSLIARRNELKTEINSKEALLDKLRLKVPSESSNAAGSLNVEDQIQRAQLQRELDWDYAELAWISTEPESPNAAFR